MSSGCQLNSRSPEPANPWADIENGLLPRATYPPAVAGEDGHRHHHEDAHHLEHVVSGAAWSIDFRCVTSTVTKAGLRPRRSCSTSSIPPSPPHRPSFKPPKSASAHHICWPAQLASQLPLLPPPACRPYGYSDQKCWPGSPLCRF